MSSAEPPPDDDGNDNGAGDGDADAPLPERWSRLPIFPLPQVHLFPGALLPLHVFEPRYRELVRDCLAGERVMAIATLEPGHQADYQGRPPVRPLIGVGQLIGHEPLPDGRSHILLRGLARARITRELPAERSYREVEAALLPDRGAAAVAASGAEATLLLLTERLSQRLPSGGDTLRSLVRDTTTPGARVDILAAALLTEADERLAVFEELDVATRIERVTATIASVLARLSSTVN